MVGAEKEINIQRGRIRREEKRKRGKKIGTEGENREI
jgi:hypothetical protein